MAEKRRRLHPPPQPVTLSDDVLSDILARLPAKSLTRFKSVSKLWCSLIENPNFINFHHHRSAQHDPNLLMFCSSSNLVSFRVILLSIQKLLVQEVRIPPIEILPRVLQLVGSCNGVLLLALTVSVLPFSLLLWNPAIFQFRWIPEFPISNFPGKVCGSYSLGFGLDSRTCNHKVVGFVYLFKGDVSRRDFEEQKLNLVEIPVIRAGVYSVNSGSWKELAEAVPAGYYDFRAVNANGALFWGGKAMGESKNRRFVLSFDVGNEVFKRIDMPDSYDNSQELKLLLAALNGSLAMLSYRETESAGNVIDIWVMKYSGNGRECWTKIYNLGGFAEIESPIGIWNDQVLMKNQQPDRADLFLYNPDSKKRIYFRIFHNFSCEIFNHAESIVPV